MSTKVYLDLVSRPPRGGKGRPAAFTISFNVRLSKSIFLHQDLGKYKRNRNNTYLYYESCIPCFSYSTLTLLGDH